MALSVRELTRGDNGGLIRQLWEDGFYETQGRSHRAQAYVRRHNLQDMKDVYQGYCESGGNFWLAEVDGQLAGFIGAYYQREGWTIQRLYVVPRYRGRGYGKALFVQALAWARAKGPYIRAYVDQHNVASQKVFDPEARLKTLLDHHLYLYYF